MSRGAVSPVPGSLSEVQAFWYSCPLSLWLFDSLDAGGGALLASDVLCGAESCCFAVFTLPVMFDMKSRVQQPSGLPLATQVTDC